jgi:hypothetical protein
VSTILLFSSLIAMPHQFFCLCVRLIKC